MIGSCPDVAFGVKETMNVKTLLQRVSLVFWLLCAVGVLLICAGGFASGAKAGELLMVAPVGLGVCFVGHKVTSWVIGALFSDE